MPLSQNLIFEGFQRKSKSLSSRGTSVAGIVTPEAEFPDQPFTPLLHEDTDGGSQEVTADIKCPKCGSRSVNIHNNGNDFFCVDCGYLWPVLDANDNGQLDDSEDSFKFKEKPVISASGSDGSSFTESRAEPRLIIRA